MEIFYLKVKVFLLQTIYLGVAILTSPQRAWNYIKEKNPWKQAITILLIAEIITVIFLTLHPKNFPITETTLNFRIDKQPGIWMIYAVISGIILNQLMVVLLLFLFLLFLKVKVNFGKLVSLYFGISVIILPVITGMLLGIYLTNETIYQSFILIGSLWTLILFVSGLRNIAGIKLSHALLLVIICSTLPFIFGISILKNVIPREFFNLIYFV